MHRHNTMRSTSMVGPGHIMAAMIGRWPVPSSVRVVHTVTNGAPSHVKPGLAGAGPIVSLSKVDDQAKVRSVLCLELSCPLRIMIRPQVVLEASAVRRRATSSASAVDWRGGGSPLRGGVPRSY